jgi:hypothetical protein
VPLTLVRRAGIVFGWMVAFMDSMATIGLIPTVSLFSSSRGRKPWSADGFPMLKAIPSM